MRDEPEESSTPDHHQRQERQYNHSRQTPAPRPGLTAQNIHQERVGEDRRKDRHAIHHGHNAGAAIEVAKLEMAVHGEGGDKRAKGDNDNGRYGKRRGDMSQGKRHEINTLFPEFSVINDTLLFYTSDALLRQAREP